MVAKTAAEAQTQRKRCYFRATAEQTFEFRILGPLEVLTGGNPRALGGAKARALLGFLLLHRGESLSRERLIDALWGERPPKAVVAELRVYIAKLRKVIPPQLLVTDGYGYALLVDAEDVDAERFEHGARRGTALLAAGDPASAARILADALALWRGAALVDLTEEPWAQVEAHRLEELRLMALEQRLEADLALGRHAGVVAELGRLAAEHPYRERPRAQLMLALYRCGRQAEALEVYRQTASVLRQELGIEPGPELRERERAILAQDPSLDARVLPRGNLPTSPTPLVGRTCELDELAALLAQPHARLVTLTGPGGSGKTRLALEVALRLERELGTPAFLVELAPLDDPSLVLPTIAQSLGVKETRGSRTLESLRAYVRNQPLLLILDNFEHLLDAAAEVAELLAAAPSLTVLATSRRPLHIRAERGYYVDPLPIEDALDLFIERVRRMRPRFAETEIAEDVSRQICERVDRLPLAIELAAALARRTDPCLLASRLDPLPSLRDGFRDAPDRHRTLWATIDWSYRLLGEEEQRLFTRLSIFRGSFSFEAAGAVCDADMEVLTALVEANMLGIRGDRYVVLETLREFADATLPARDRRLTRRLHAEFFLTVAQEARTELTGADAPAALERLEADLDNLRLALGYWLDADSPERLLSFVSSLSRLFAVSARSHEGVLWMSRALERTVMLTVDPRVRRAALIAAAALNDQSGDVEEARALYEQALAVARSGGDRAGESAALTGLATIAGDSGDGVISMQKRAVELSRDAGAERELAIGLDNLARLHLINGDLDAAAEELVATMKIHERLGDVINACVSLQELANVTLHRGDPDAAIALFGRTVVDGQRLRSPWLAGAGVEGLAVALLERGTAPATVARLLGASEALFEASGLADRYIEGYFATVSRTDRAATLKARVRTQVRKTLDPATCDRAWAEGRSLAAEAAVELALATCGSPRRDKPLTSDLRPPG